MERKFHGQSWIIQSCVKPDRFKNHLATSAESLRAGALRPSDCLGLMENYGSVQAGDKEVDPAQDMQSNLGKVLRLNDDGTPVKDNPFIRKAVSRRKFGHWVIVIHWVWLLIRKAESRWWRWGQKAVMS